MEVFLYLRAKQETSICKLRSCAILPFSFWSCSFKLGRTGIIFCLEALVKAVQLTRHWLDFSVLLLGLIESELVDDCLLAGLIWVFKFGWVLWSVLRFLV